MPTRGPQRMFFGNLEILIFKAVIDGGAGRSRYLGLGTYAWVPTLTTRNLEIQAIGNWTKQCGYLGIGTQAWVLKLATANPEKQAIGNWAGQSRYLCLSIRHRAFRLVGRV